MEEPEPVPHILSPCTSTGRRRSVSNSPEFEFWIPRNNPSNCPPPNLLSADELFSHGFLRLSTDPSPPPPKEPDSSGSGQPPEPEQPSATSKRWTDIFKKNEKKFSESEDGMKEKECRSTKEKFNRKKINGGANMVSAAELNINIWPFSRSKSAGNGATRPRAAAAGGRKVNSAPCSRSNSTARKMWPNSPGRAGGVHLGRTSPVWHIRQVRSGGGGRSSSGCAVKSNDEKGLKKDGNQARRKVPTGEASGGSKGKVMLGLSVPMCIGYRHNLSCRSDENSPLSVAAAEAAAGGGGGGVSGEGVRRINLFNIRSLFTKKVY